MFVVVAGPVFINLSFVWNALSLNSSHVCVCFRETFNAMSTDCSLSFCVHVKPHGDTVAVMTLRCVPLFLDGLEA
jgi:hypothetical protein